MEKDFICIVCPKGCRINIKDDIISGNSCPRGKNYVIQELTDPKRMITSSFKVKNSNFLVCPCKTTSAISKNLMFDIMNEINKLEISSPIRCGQIVIKNVLNTGVDIIATKEIK